ncbi:hypothetical protein LCGC14_0267490 [marine sediment metagenome]|uniref:Uncharacterized protein n=1 Tax=marine sediment metagenome TaxID=412755 RepID=A0A0F9X4U3_9ZZZZ
MDTNDIEKQIELLRSKSKTNYDSYNIFSDIVSPKKERMDSKRSTKLRIQSLPDMETIDATTTLKIVFNQLVGSDNVFTYPAVLKGSKKKLNDAMDIYHPIVFGFNVAKSLIQNKTRLLKSNWSHIWEILELALAITPISRSSTADSFAGSMDYLDDKGNILNYGNGNFNSKVRAAFNYLIVDDKISPSYEKRFNKLIDQEVLIEKSKETFGVNPNLEEYTIDLLTEEQQTFYKCFFDSKSNIHFYLRDNPKRSQYKQGNTHIEVVKGYMHRAGISYYNPVLDGTIAGLQTNNPKLCVPYQFKQFLNVISDDTLKLKPFSEKNLTVKQLQSKLDEKTSKTLKTISERSHNFYKLPFPYSVKD